MSILLLLAALALPPTPQIDIVGEPEGATSVEGEAPFAVHVDGLESPLGVGDPLTAHYAWDFGDTAEGAVHNEIVGFGAAHVYDTPGTYTLTLTVTNEAREAAAATVTVTVRPSTRRAVYVADDGDDAADGLTPATAVRTVGRAQALLGSDTDLLFRRGDRFDVTAEQLAVDGLRNVRIGAWGEGARPVLASSAPWVEGQGVAVVAVTGASTRVVVEGLRFERPTLPPPEHLGSWQAVTFTGGDVRNAVVRDCDFHQMTYNTAVLHRPPAADDTPRGVLVMENMSDIVGHYHVWASGGGRNVTVLGNTVGNSLNGHVVRFYADRVFVYRNDFGSTGYDAAGCQQIFGTTDCIGNQTVSVAATAYSYVAGNTLRSRNRIGYQTEYGFTTAQWVVWEGNRHVRTTEPDLPTLRLYRGSHHLAVRNNVFDGAQYAIRLDGEGDPDTPAHDVFVLHNTYVHAGPAAAGSVLELYDPVDARGTVTVAGNLAVDPAYEGGLEGGYPYLVSIGGTTGFTFADNLWPTPVRGEPHVVAGAPLTADQWTALPVTSGDAFHAMAGLGDRFAPDPGSPAAGHAAARAGLHTDFHGRPRPATGRWTAGAVEAVGATGAGDAPEPPGLAVDAHPNPVRHVTTLRVRLAAPAEVTVTVHDALGRMVRQVPLGPRGAGAHDVALDAAGLAPGIYLARVVAGAAAATRAVTVLR